jgi:hypothetical protein
MALVAGRGLCFNCLKPISGTLQKEQRSPFLILVD